MNAAVYAVKNGVPKTLTTQEFYEQIDFKAAPDGTGGFHYRWTGKTIHVSQGKYQRPTPIQRFAELIGDKIPNGFSEMWCRDEAPWCMNPDHIIRDDELPSASAAEFVIDDGEGHKEFSGMGVVHLDWYESPARALRGMESHWEEGDSETDKWLREHGYNAKGEPMKG